jgi:peptidoglycan/xylan/chitin deacetylase (PgdA/CDA1 family)
VKNKQAIIFIDTESSLEGPWRQELDFQEGIQQIARMLERYKVTAVFNACGKLLEQNPETFRNLQKAGNEIALHGWKHENLRLLDNEWLDRVLTRGHRVYLDVLGRPPLGFRAPWLDYDHRLLEWLARNRYKWVSHSHIFHRERFFSPGARPEIRTGQKLAGMWSVWQERRFLKHPQKNEQGLLEIPLTSSMDGELLGLVSPLQPSPARTIDFAVTAWHRQMERSRGFFTLNLHDWLMSSANRPDLLNKVLNMLLSNGYKIITTQQLI